MNCEARKGFLTLSSCENPAARACANCGRSLCPTHLAPTDFSMCLDCAATTSQQQQQGANDPRSEGDYDDVWAHRYRSNYYSTTGYSPTHSSRSSYYDNQDTSSFRDRNSEDLEDDTAQGGFGES
jgi:hypothetical protein